MTDEEIVNNPIIPKGAFRSNYWALWIVKEARKELIEEIDKCRLRKLAWLKGKKHTQITHEERIRERVLYGLIKKLTQRESS